MAPFDPPINASLQAEEGECDLFSDDDARFRAALDACTREDLLTLAVTEYGLHGYRDRTPHEEIVADIIGIDTYLYGPPNGERPDGL